MSSVAVVMFTVDHYHPAWPPFCHGFHKYWPDCPWPLKVVTNHLDAPCGETVKVGDDLGWCSNAIHGLDKIRASTVVLTCDDFWLAGPVDTGAMRDFVAYVQHGDAVYIRLWTEGRAKQDIAFEPDPRLFIFAPAEKHRASIQCSIWKVDDFRGLLKHGESCWNFEDHSRERSGGSLKYLCVKSNEYFPYTYGDEWHSSPLSKGKWTDGARKYAEREGLEIDFSKNIR